MRSSDKEVQEFAAGLLQIATCSFKTCQMVLQQRALPVLLVSLLQLQLAGLAQEGAQATTGRGSATGAGGSGDSKSAGGRGGDDALGLGSCSGGVDLMVWSLVGALAALTGVNSSTAPSIAALACAAPQAMQVLARLIAATPAAARNPSEVEKHNAIYLLWNMVEVATSSQLVALCNVPGGVVCIIMFMSSNSAAGMCFLTVRQLMHRRKGCCNCVSWLQQARSVAINVSSFFYDERGQHLPIAMQPLSLQARPWHVHDSPCHPL